MQPQVVAEGSAHGRKQSVGRFLSRTPTLDKLSVEEVEGRVKEQQISPQWFHDGDLLPQLAKEHCSNFAYLLGAERLKIRRGIRWGSACTGSAGDMVLAQVVQSVFRTYCESFKIDYLFSCEIKEYKQKWIRNVHQLVSSGSAEGEGVEGARVVARDPCMFADVMHLGGEKCKCIVHGSNCRVPNVDVFHCCTSCKDMAKNNNTPNVMVLNKPESKGGSAQTWRGMLSYIDSARPSIVFWENVDTVEKASKDDQGALPESFDKSFQSNMDVVLAEFGGRGYECQIFDMNSTQFGVPQNRERVFVVAFLSVAATAIEFEQRGVETVVGRMRSLIKVCQRRPPCASKLLLASDHERVQQELARRKECPPQQRAASGSGYNMGNTLAQATKMGASAPWKMLETPDILMQSEWCATLTAMQHDTASISLRTHSAANHLVRDIGQSVVRVRRSSMENGIHIAPAVLPTQKMLITGSAEGVEKSLHVRIMLGEEALIFQGFPTSKLFDNPSFSPIFPDVQTNATMADIAGNMVTLPILLALVLSAFSSVTWRAVKEGDEAAIESTEEEIEFAASAAFLALNRSSGSAHGSGGQKRASQQVGSGVRRRLKIFSAASGPEV